jgi:hypothetical protein
VDGLGSSLAGNFSRGVVFAANLRIAEFNRRNAFRVPEGLFERRDRGEARYARWWAELQIEPSDPWCYVSATSFRFRFDATGYRAYGLPPVHLKLEYLSQ